MAAQEGPLLARLARLGMGAIDPAQGLTALQAALQCMSMSFWSAASLHTRSTCQLLHLYHVWCRHLHLSVP